MRVTIGRAEGEYDVHRVVGGVTETHWPREAGGREAQRERSIFGPGMRQRDARSDDDVRAVLPDDRDAPLDVALRCGTGLAQQLGGGRDGCRPIL